MNVDATALLVFSINVSSVYSLFWDDKKIPLRSIFVYTVDGISVFIYEVRYMCALIRCNGHASMSCLEEKVFTLAACKPVKFTSVYTVFFTLDGFSPSSATLLCLHHVRT